MATDPTQRCEASGTYKGSAAPGRWLDRCVCPKCGRDVAFHWRTGTIRAHHRPKIASR